MKQQCTGRALLKGAAILLLLCTAAALADGETRANPPRNRLANWAIILICMAVAAGVMLTLLCVFAVAYCVVVSNKGWIDFRAYFTHMAP